MRQKAGLLTLLTVAVVASALIVSPASAQDEVPPDYYPNLGFPLLHLDERQVFVGIAEGELCPCTGTPRSLSECLLDETSRCRLAEDVASLMMRHIKEDDAPPVVRDAITTFITDAQTARTFELGAAPQRGPSDAPVQIVIFSDFECPFCRRFANTTDLLVEQFGDQVAVYYKHFPLPQHQAALPAARAAMAAHQQGRFWEMHDLLFEHQSDLDEADEIDDYLAELAEELGLDMAQFRQAYENPDLVDLAMNDREEGRAAGVNATPTLFINGLKFLEDESFSPLRAHINALLEEQN